MERWETFCEASQFAKRSAVEVQALETLHAYRHGALHAPNHQY